MIERLLGRGAGRGEGMPHRRLPWPVALAIVVLLHVVSAYFVLQLQVNNSPEVYYPADSPAVTLRGELRADFPSDEVLTVVFQGDDLYGQAFLARLDRLGELLQDHPLVDRVTSVTSLERISGSEDGFAVERLLDPAKLKGVSPEAARQRVLDDRFAPGALASRDGSTLAVAVRPKPLTQSAERQTLRLAVMDAVERAGLGPYYRGDAGPVTVDVAQLQSVLDDSMLFVPLTVTIGLLLLGWVVGRLRPVVIGAVAMSTVVLPMLAAVSISGQPYTMATAILPSLLAAYTLATLLHLYAAVQRAQIGQPSKARCVDNALGWTLRPGAYNVLTTGAGLLSLVFVPIPPIQVFGIAGAFGTLLVFLTVFFLVPPFLVSWDKRPWPVRGSGMNRLGRIASRLTLTSMRYPKTMVVVFAGAMVAAIPLATQVVAESDMLAFFDEAHPVTRHTELVESKLAGLTSLEISVRGEGRDALQDVSTLATLRDFQRWLDALPEVDRSVSMVDLVEEMHWAMNGEKPAFRALPGNDRLLRQYLLVYDGEDLYELVNRDFQHARILLNLNVHGANEIGRTIDAIKARLATHPLPGLTVDVGGYGRLFADQVDLLVTGQVNSFASAFAQIFLFMAILWRSLAGAALCLVPNLTPLFFIFVLMGATGIHLDLATVMIAGVVLGITVDDTIHLYHGYLHRRQSGIAPVLAIARSFESSGRAVLAISVVLVAQFLLMATSDFVPTSNFGLMVAVGLLAGQLAELLLLPALLVLTHRFQSSARVPAGGTAADPAWAPTQLLRRQELPGRGRAVDERTHHDDAWAPTQLVEYPEQAPGGGPGDMPAPAPPADTTAGVVHILVCMGPACLSKGGVAVWKALSKGRVDADRTRVIETSCLGPCESGPIVQVCSRAVTCTAREPEAVADEALRVASATVLAARPGAVPPRA